MARNNMFGGDSSVFRWLWCRRLAIGIADGKFLVTTRFSSTAANENIRCRTSKGKRA
jgi:hypothetical protein